MCGFYNSNENLLHIAAVLNNMYIIIITVTQYSVEEMIR